MILFEYLKMTETEYLEALNKATNGAMVRQHGTKDNSRFKNQENKDDL